MNNSYLSIAIPTYNSSEYLLRLLKSISKFNLVNEVVIQDDFSSKEEIEAIEKIVSSFPTDKLEIKIYRNEKNLGAFSNKVKAVCNCKNEFVYQIDSDNLPGRNLDLVFQSIIKDKDKNLIYYPSKLIQTIEDSILKKLKYLLFQQNNVLLSKDDKLLSLLSIQNAIKNNEKITINKNYRWILNCGNFIVNKEMFKNIFEINNFEINDYFILDAVAFNYFWLKNKGQIKLLKNHYHFHRKRANSVSILNAEKTIESFDYFERKILSL